MMFALLFQYISLSKKQIRVLIMTLMCFPKRRRRFDSTSEVYATTVSSSIAVAIAVFLFDHEFVVSWLSCQSVPIEILSTPRFVTESLGVFFGRRANLRNMSSGKKQKWDAHH